MKRISKRRSKRTQKYDVVAMPNSLSMSVSKDSDKKIVNVGIDGFSETEKKELFAEAVNNSDMTCPTQIFELVYFKGFM